MTKKVLFKNINDGTKLFNQALDYLVQTKVTRVKTNFAPEEKERQDFLVDFFERLQSLKSKDDVRDVYQHFYNTLDDYRTIITIASGNNVKISKYIAAIISVQLGELIEILAKNNFSRVDLRRIIKAL